MTETILSSGKVYDHTLHEIRGFFGPWRFLSNFHFFPVEYDGVVYPTNEHAYQAAKTNDLLARDEIRRVSRPGEARRLGQQVVLRPDWGLVQLPIMVDLNLQKYADVKLGTMLLESEEAYLEETNHWGDVYWGVCNGIGENKLGKLLMDIRDDLRAVRHQF